MGEGFNALLDQGVNGLTCTRERERPVLHERLNVSESTGELTLISEGHGGRQARDQKAGGRANWRGVGAGGANFSTVASRA